MECSNSLLCCVHFVAAKEGERYRDPVASGGDA